jgi:hypothetical protein
VIEHQERWLTYAAAGELLGISPEAVRQLARRRGWPRRTPNAYGVQAQILMPEDVLVRPRPGLTGGQPPYERGMTEQRVSGLDRADEPGDRAFENADLIRIFRDTVEGLVTPLREQLTTANQWAEAERARADRAERHLEEERGCVDEERRRIDELRTALDRMRVELADAVAAERIAAGEATGLRAEVERLITERRRPWWRRWFR